MSNEFLAHLIAICSRMGSIFNELNPQKMSNYSAVFYAKETYYYKIMPPAPKLNDLWTRKQTDQPHINVYYVKIQQVLQPTSSDATELQN
jgi:hypothetical protein